MPAGAWGVRGGMGGGCVCVGGGGDRDFRGDIIGITGTTAGITGITTRITGITGITMVPAGITVIPVIPVEIPVIPLPELLKSRLSHCRNY